MNDQVAIITGGSRGIGREIALAYAREGCNVALVARDAAKLEQTAALIFQETGREALSFVLDITDNDAVQAMARDVSSKWKRIDILVNAAAIVGPIGPFEEPALDGWEQTMKVNVLGTYDVVQAVLPTMIQQKRGR